MKIPGSKYISRIFEQYRSSQLLSRLGTVMGVDILVKAAAFLLLPFYLYYMSQAEFGLFNYILTIINTLSLVLNLGLYIPVSKYYHSDSGKTSRGILLFTIFSSLIAGISLILLVFYFFRWDFWLIDLLLKAELPYQEFRGWIFLALFVSALSFSYTSYLFTSERIRLIKYYSLSRVVLVHGLSILLIAFSSENKVLIRLQVSYLVELAILLAFSYPLVREISVRFKMSILKKGLKMGLPVMVSALLGLIINFGDKFILEKFGNLQDLSQYYLAFSFASILPMVFSSIQNVWLPLFMKEKKPGINYQRTKKLIRRLSLAFILLSILILLGFQLAIYLKIVPEVYSRASGILPLLLGSQLFASLTAVYGNYFIYFERTHIITITGLFVSVFSISAAFILVPVWNIYGAALSLLLSNCGYLLIYRQLVKRLVEKFPQ